jgi:hypothetical protein
MTSLAGDPIKLKLQNGGSEERFGLFWAFSETLDMHP